MIDLEQIHSVPRLRSPVLSAYLDTNPGNPRNQGRPPGYITWLKAQGQALLQRVAENQRSVAKKQLVRISKYLQTRPPVRRGAIFFSGPYSWEFLELQVELQDELQWGRPSFKQLLWILDEHRPVGAVVVKREAARFLRISFGEIVEDGESAVSVDTSAWRKKDLVGPSHPNVLKAKGSQRDAFESRVREQYARFFRELADHIREWANQRKISMVVLVGPNRILKAISENLPAAFRERIALLKEDLSSLSLSDLQARLIPVIKRWDRTHELNMVNHLLSSERSSQTAVGFRSTLANLQQGRVRQLVIARGVRGEIQQCESCGSLDCSERGRCENCGNQCHKVELRMALPELARRYAVPVKVVGGEAAIKLRSRGGVAAWLHYNPR
jgi:Bacterial archaeo-eukaryotic release factor family 10